MKNILKTIGCIVLCQLAGLIGSIFTFEAIPTWYAALNKPPLNPPNWVFGPVWTILYTLMGISLFLLWKKGDSGIKIKPAVIIFIIQLILNSAWSIVFFGVKSILGAFILITFLWLAIFINMIQFNKISKTAAYMLLPYLLWVSFASYLNLFIYIHNN